VHFLIHTNAKWSVGEPELNCRWHVQVDQYTFDGNSSESLKHTTENVFCFNYFHVAGVFVLGEVQNTVYWSNKSHQTPRPIFLRALEIFWKSTVSFVMFVRLSICMEKTRLPLEEFSWNFIFFGNLLRNCWEISSSNKIWRDKLVLYMKTFVHLMYIYDSISLNSS